MPHFLYPWDLEKKSKYFNYKMNYFNFINNIIPILNRRLCAKSLNLINNVIIACNEYYKDDIYNVLFTQKDMEFILEFDALMMDEDNEKED